MTLSTAPPAALKDASIPPAVLSVLSGLDRQGHRAYLVGGCVRDMLLGKFPHDFDVATSALPAEVQKAFKKVIPTGIQHGTVTVLSEGHAVEVTTFRSEGPYLDGRRPSEVHFRLEVADDLSRRDFTVNAMAYAPHRNEFCDPFSGILDLQLGLIRCVGDPLDRFNEDGLRALRAVRFASVLGFAIHPRTLSAIPETLTVFAKVAKERIWQELSKVFLSPRAAFGIGTLAESGLLGSIWPEAAEVPKPHMDRALRALGYSEASLEVRLAVFLALVVGPIEHISACLERLKVPTQLATTVMTLVPERDFQVTPDLSNGDARRWLSRWDVPMMNRFFSFQHAIRQARDIEIESLAGWDQRMKDLLAEKPILHSKGLALNGNAIMKELGVGPSPIVGEATRYLMEEVLENPESNSASTLAQILRKWMASRGH